MASLSKRRVRNSTHDGRVTDLRARSALGRHYVYLGLDSRDVICVNLAGLRGIKCRIEYIGLRIGEGSVPAVRARGLITCYNKVIADIEIGRGQSYSRCRKEEESQIVNEGREKG